MATLHFRTAALTTGRALTALVGGYAAAAAVATLAARLLPLTRAEATAWGMTLSFLLYAVLALWAYAEQRFIKVAAVIWGMAAVAAGTSAMLGMRP